jgi:class 3 adenylate cyclase
VRQAVEKHRGRWIKSTGDGVLATFDGPGRAVRPTGLSLRAGLHTGEIEMRGDDVGGLAVHAASRVLSLCEPGEVLVSRVVTELTAGAGLKFSERGARDLKGLPGAWELYAASAWPPIDVQAPSYSNGRFPHCRRLTTPKTIPSRSPGKQSERRRVSQI